MKRFLLLCLLTAIVWAGAIAWFEYSVAETQKSWPLYTPASETVPPYGRMGRINPDGSPITLGSRP